MILRMARGPLVLCQGRTRRRNGTGKRARSAARTRKTRQQPAAARGIVMPDLPSVNGVRRGSTAEGWIQAVLEGGADGQRVAWLPRVMVGQMNQPVHRNRHLGSPALVAVAPEGLPGLDGTRFGVVLIRGDRGGAFRLVLAEWRGSKTPAAAIQGGRAGAEHQGTAQPGKNLPGTRAAGSGGSRDSHHDRDRSRRWIVLSWVRPAMGKGHGGWWVVLEGEVPVDPKDAHDAALSFRM